MIYAIRNHLIIFRSTLYNPPPSLLQPYILTFILCMKGNHFNCVISLEPRYIHGKLHFKFPF